MNGPRCVGSILLRRQSIFSRMNLLNSYLVVCRLEVQEYEIDYFNRINFREIKFRVFASFCHFREIKTRENVEIDR